MKLLIDNNLSPRLAQALQELGFDCIHVRDYAMQKATDEEIFLKALKEERVVVSADTDFGFLLARWNKEKPSLILFRNFSPLLDDQLNALKQILGEYQSELNSGSVIVREPKGIRIRELPLY